MKGSDVVKVEKDYEIVYSGSEDNHPDSTTTLALRCISLAEHWHRCTLFYNLGPA